MIREQRKYYSSITELEIKRVIWGNKTLIIEWKSLFSFRIANLLLYVKFPESTYLYNSVTKFLSKKKLIKLMPFRGLR